MRNAIAVFLLLACGVALADERAAIVDRRVEKGKDRFETEFAPGRRLQPGARPPTLTANSNCRWKILVRAVHSLLTTSDNQPTTCSPQNPVE
jgi:hypothetical protein